MCETPPLIQERLCVQLLLPIQMCCLGHMEVALHLQRCVSQTVLSGTMVAQPLGFLVQPFLRLST